MSRSFTLRSTCMLVLLLAPLVVDAAAPHRIDLPAEGATLNRTQLQFRWDTFHEFLGGFDRVPGLYTLEVVIDDGSPDPFVAGSPVLAYPVAGDEPRTVVRAGLEFGTEYAWRVKLTRFASAVPAISTVRRFSTDPISVWVPPMQLTIPPGAGPVEPGLTCWNVRRNGLERGFIVCVNEAGKMVLQYQPPEHRMGDMRLMDDGRLLYNATGPRGTVPACRWSAVMTVDGKEIWNSPIDHCYEPQFGISGPHHEVFPMPPTAPRGANFLLLEFDNRRYDFFDEHDGVFYDNHYFRGPIVNEYDRHTKQILRSWAGLDNVCLEDHLPPEHPRGPHPPSADIMHGNAAVYDVATGRVVISLRRQSRIVVVEWEQGETPFNLFSIGEWNSWPGGDPFPCAPECGDNLFSAQHAPEVLPNGNWMVFDNGNYIEPIENERKSRVVEIAFGDPDDPCTASTVWEFTLVEPDLTTPAFADFVGDADRLPNGNTLTVDGRHSYIMEADPAGQVVWYMVAGVGWPGENEGAPDERGTQIYRVEKIPDLILDTPGDTDGDWDLDLADFAGLQAHFTGPVVSALGFPARLSNHDGDRDIDRLDVDAFAYWMTGPAR